MSKARSAALLGLTLVALTACQPAPAATAVPTAPRPATAPPTATDRPAPTARPTAAPTPAATADLDWLLGSSAAEAAYRIPLMSRHVTATTAYLQFEFAQSFSGQIVVWPADRAEEPIFVPVEGSGGLLSVQGLTPDRRYLASLITGQPPDDVRRPTLAGGVWPPIEFRTQGAAAPFTVGVLGDSGFGDPVTAALVRQMATHEIDFTLHTGDIVYRVHENPDPPAAFVAKLYAPLAPLLAKGPFYPVPGNHEYDRPTYWENQPYYRHAFPHLPPEAVRSGEGNWYSFGYRGVQFVMLDSQVLFGAPGRSALEAWLDQRLADDRYRYSVVVMHVPPYTVGRHRTDSRVVASRWAERFERAAVPLVLSGHDHNYQRFQVGDSAYVVTGGGSAVTYPLQGSDPRLREASARSHFVTLRFDVDRIVIEASDQAGIVFDRGLIPVPSPADG